MENALEGMTQDRWNALSQDEREALRAPAYPVEYAPHVGWRVEVTTSYGKVRGIVGRSTGWKPCYILRSRRSAFGGYQAPEAISIRRLYRVF